ADEMPLGSGALAATTLPLHREVVAKELGFDRLTLNSVDAVSDRDFTLDLAYASSSTAIHLSRLGEDIVLWATAEFGFVVLADETATRPTLMPQEKNPDAADLLPRATGPGFLPQGAGGGRRAGSGRGLQSTLERAGVAREARSPRRAQPAPSGGESPGASPRGRGLAPLEPSSPASPADLRTGPPSRPHFGPLDADTCLTGPGPSPSRIIHAPPL